MMQEGQETTIQEYQSQRSSSYNSYDKYRETEIEWLGCIPEHWSLNIVDQIAQLKPGFSFDSDNFDTESGFPLIRIRNIRGESINLYYNGEISPEMEQVIVEKGDIIVGMDGDFRVYWWDDKDALLNQRMTRITSADYHHRRFLYYLLPRALEYIQKITASTTVKHLSTNDIRKIKVPKIPQEEREAIVAFLDKETEKTDNLIDKKEELIKLLKEKRAATINSLVTSGVNNDPKEQSELDWFNTIPTSWETTSLSNTVDKFVDYRGATPEKSDSGITLITAKNIDDGNLDFSEDHEYVSEEVYEDWMTRGYPEEGDVLITTEAPMGEVAQVEDTPVALAQRIILLKPNTNLIKKGFLKCFLESEFNQTQLMKSQTGSTAKGIQASKLKGIRVLIPPLVEQEKILEEIEQEIKKIDELISEIEEGIERLKEYRTALITEAVTGQIDVWGEV